MRLGLKSYGLHSPLIADIKAARSSAGLAAVARELVAVIRPEAARFDTTTSDARAAAARMRSHLRERFPNLESRISFGPVVSTPECLIGSPPAPGVIAATVTEGLTIELLAPGGSAEVEPIECKITMTEAGLAKIQEMQRTGVQVELGPEDLIDFSSVLVDAFKPLTGPTETKRLILGPSRSEAPKRLPLRLTIKHGGKCIEYPFVEFEVTRSGSQTLEIKSSSTTAPMQWVVRFDLVEKSGSVQMASSIVGHEIREVFKADQALNLAMAGGSIDLYNLETDQAFPTLPGKVNRNSEMTAEDSISRSDLISAAYSIAMALNEKVYWPTAISGDEAGRILQLWEVVSTGHLSLSAESISVTLRPNPGMDIAEELRKGQQVTIRDTSPLEFSTLFGRPVDLGPYSMEFQSTSDLSMWPVGDGSVRAEIGLEKPITLTFDRFVPSRGSDSVPQT